MSSEIDGVTCLKCGGVEITIENVFNEAVGSRRKASCAYCGTYIKFLPSLDSSGDFIMPFGKHKGEKLDQIPRDYLHWILINLRLQSRMKHHVTSVLGIK